MELLLLKVENEKNIVKRIDLYLDYIKEHLSNKPDKVIDVITLVDKEMQQWKKSKQYKRQNEIYTIRFLDLCLYKSHLFWFNKDFQRLQHLVQSMTIENRATVQGSRIMLFFAQGLFDEGQYRESEIELNKIIDLSKKNNWTNLHSTGLRLKATILFHVHKSYISAITLLQDAKSQLNPDNEEESKTLLNIKSSMVSLLTRYEVYDIAIQYSYDILQHHIASNNLTNIIACYAHLAVLHIKTKFLDKAIVYYNSALEYAEKLNSKRFIYQLKIDIATAILFKQSTNQNEIVIAYQYLKEAEESISLISYGHQSLLYQGLSEYYYQSNDMRLSETYCKQCISMAEVSGVDKRNYYFQLAKIMTHQSQESNIFQEGLSTLEKLYKNLNNTNELSLRLQIIEYLAQLHLSKKNYEASSRLYKELYDVTIEQQTINNTKSLEMHFALLETNIKETELDALKQQYAISEEEKKRLMSELQTSSVYINQHIESMNTLKSDIFSLVKEIDDVQLLIESIKKRLRDAAQLQKTSRMHFDDSLGIHTSLKKALLDKSPTLTRTEIQICLLIKSGLSNSQIAALLMKSIRTIENHRNNIRKKLRADSNQNLTTLLEKMLLKE